MGSVVCEAVAAVPNFPVIAICGTGLHDFGRLAVEIFDLQAKASDLADEVLHKLSRDPSQSSLETSSMLPLVGLAERLQSQIAIQDARFRGHISDLQDELSKQFGGQERLTPAFLRLQSPDVSLPPVAVF